MRLIPEQITPEEGMRASLIVLSLAEQYERWDLYKALLSYFEDAGATVRRIGPSEYLLHIEKE